MNSGDLAVDDLPVVGAGPVARVHVVRGPDGVAAALKVFAEPMDRFTRTAFDRERKALGTLTHVSSILQVDSVDELPDGRPGLRMELCEQSLGQLLEACGTLSLPDVTAIGQAVAAALTAAHEAGVVHGAVSPHNVLLRADGEPVLADFGLALRHRYPQAPGPWAAPEAAFTEQSDLFGLGAVLYTALTGRPPRDPEPRDLPEPLRELLAGLLAEDPADRPVDAATVLAELTGEPLPAETSTADPVPGDFDDFAEDVERGSAQQVQDEFFAEWEGKAPSTQDTSAEPPPRSRHGKAVGVAAALAVLIAVPVLARRQPPATIETGPPTQYAAPGDATVGFTVQSTHTIEFELDPPVDKGRTVTLTWHSDTDLDYAVVVAGASLPTKVMRAPRGHSMTIPVEPGRRYCFQVQGTDGEQTYETTPRPIRRAVCGH